MPDSCQVYVGFLPNNATMEDVEHFFRGYGKIKSINLKPGYGFVVFEDRRDADDAVKDLDGQRMCGERVDIQIAKGPGNKARDRRGDGRPVVRDSRRESRSRSRGAAVAAAAAVAGGDLTPAPDHRLDEVTVNLATRSKSKLPISRLVAVRNV